MKLINVQDQFNKCIGSKITTGPVVINKLTDEDIGRAVVFDPNDDRMFSKEFGYIKSWNDCYVFVRFNEGVTAAACYPNQLQFAK